MMDKVVELRASHLESLEDIFDAAKVQWRELVAAMEDREYCEYSQRGRAFLSAAARNYWKDLTVVAGLSNRSEVAIELSWWEFNPTSNVQIEFKHIAFNYRVDRLLPVALPVSGNSGERLLSGLATGRCRPILLKNSVFRSARKIASPQRPRCILDVGGDAASHCAPPRAL